LYSSISAFANRVEENLVNVGKMGARALFLGVEISAKFEKPNESLDWAITLAS